LHYYIEDSGNLREGEAMRKFFVVWTGQAFSLFGSALVQFALAWWLTKSTGSATVLATATLVALLPQVLAGPFVGTLVDRWDRKRIMIAADCAIALVTAGLVALFVVGVIRPWHIYLASLARGLGQTFHFPAMQAATPLLVPKEHLARVAGLNQGLQGAIAVVAPPVGALALGLLPAPAVLAVDIVTAAIAVSCLAAVAIPRPEPSAAGAAGAVAAGRRGVLADMAAGFRYVRAWPGLVLLMAMAAILNFFLVPTSSLLPILVVKHFGGGPLQLSWLEAAMGVGLVVGGLGLGAWGGFKRRMHTSLLGVSIAGAGIGAVGLVPAGLLGAAVVLTFVAGAALSLANGPLFAVMQATVAKDMQGRIFTLVGSLSGAMMPLGLALAGPVSDLIGVRTWYLVAGAVTVAMAAAGFFVPSLMRIEDHTGQTRVEVPTVS
jgi:DHA3 family macrolide efflux protein-like MFS transporter